MTSDGPASRDAVLDRLTNHFDHTDPELTNDVATELYHRLLEEPGIPRSDAVGGFRLLAHYDDAVAALTNVDVFCTTQGVMLPTHPGDPPLLPQELAGREHSDVRGVFMDVMSARRVDEIEPYIQGTLQTLLSRFAAQGGGDFYQEVAAQLPLQVIGEMLGWSADARVQIKGVLEGGFRAYEAEGVQGAIAVFAEILEQEIEDRRSNPRADKLTSIVNGEAGPRPLSETEMVRVLMVFASAGFHTTAHAIGNLVAEMARDQELQALLRGNPSLIPGAVEESLRLFPPVHNFFRTVAETTELRGSTLEAGEKVAVLYAAANRDPQKFEHPDEFCPARPNARQHLAFSWGPHLCAGARLARLEMRVLVEQLLRDLPPFELVEPPRHTPQLVTGHHMGVEYLPLRFIDQA